MKLFVFLFQNYGFVSQKECERTGFQFIDLISGIRRKSRAEIATEEREEEREGERERGERHSGVNKALEDIERQKREWAERKKQREICKMEKNRAYNICYKSDKNYRDCMKEKRNHNICRKYTSIILCEETTKTDYQICLKRIP